MDVSHGIGLCVGWGPPSDVGVVARLLNVIGPDEHSYITDSNTYTNAAAGRVMAFAAEAAQTLGLAPPSLATWKSMADSMLIDTQKFCRPWQNASVDGCPEGEVVTIHPQYDGYHGQDINQADVALLQWPLHLPMAPEVAAADLEYYASRSSGSDTKGFYTGMTTTNTPSQWLVC